MPKIATELSVIYLFLLVGLPLSLALYSSKGKVQTQDLEKDFKNL
jgi:hypothetical protein